jgi:membrane protease YdiL (CAAX protease family)
MPVESAINRVGNKYLPNPRAMVLGKFPAYGLFGLLLLCVGIVVLSASVMWVHATLWPTAFTKYSYYDSPIAIVSVVTVVFYKRPQLLAASRWRLRICHLTIGLTVGSVVPVMLWIFTRDPVHEAGLRLPPYSAFFPAIVLAPVVEELFCRGILLRSLKSYFPASAAIAITAVGVSLVHRHFWGVLPMQATLSILYVVLGDSIPTSILAHITNNSVVLLLSTGLFDRLHSYVWN